MDYTQQDIQDNMGLVFMVARGMNFISTKSGDVMEFQDLISEGTLGLIHALERFDPERGFRFSSYAFKCIRFYMLRGHRLLFGEHWKARASGISSHTVSLFEKDSVEPIYGVSDNGMSATSTFDKVHRQCLWEKLHKRLTPRQKDVVNLSRQGLSQTEIAKQLGVSRQAVHITYNYAVRRAKKCFRRQAA